MKRTTKNMFPNEEINRIKCLLDISRKIGALKELSHILWTIIDFATENVNADRGSIFLNDSETNELYSRVAQGLSLIHI